MKKFRIVTLGCRTNQYESQAYRDQLLSLGYEEAKGEEEADLCIVNSCTVTASADSSSRHQIRQLAKKNPGTKLLVTGCLADRKPELIEKIGGVSAVIPNKRKERLLEEIIDPDSLPEFRIKNFEAHTRAFVKVQDGCNSFCTYCIIPYVRGRSRCRPIKEVVKEVEGLVANGYKEVVITGINVGDYDDEGKSLADLMRAVDRIEGLERLRLSSIDPDEIDEDLLDAIVGGRTTCNSMHIVLQSGSNVILKRMNRKYTRQIFWESWERLKAADPDFTCTTDIIFGFPGETERDFQESLEMVEQIRFAKVHSFPYSKRERTRAALYDGEVPQEVMAERKQRLARLCEKVAYTLREEYVGREMEVLVEGDGLGHTTNFLPVKLSGRRNTLRRVVIERNSAEALHAHD